MTKSLDELFSNKSNKPKTLDELFSQPQQPLPVEKKFQQPNTPPIPSATTINYNDYLMPAHTVSQPEHQPDYKSAWEKATIGSLVGRALTPLVEKVTGKKVDISTLPDPQTLGEKVVSFIGSNGSDLPLWLTGDALLAKPLGALAKTAPIAKAIDFLPKSITPALGTGVKAGTTWAGGIAPLTSAVTGEKLADLEKQTPYIFAGGTALHGAGQLVGEGINSAKNTILEHQLNYPELSSNPLLDVQNAYKTSNLRDVKANELNKTFADNSNNLANTGQIAPIQAMTPEELANQKRLDAQSVFGNPINNKTYKFTTSEQRAFQNLQDGIEEAQNYVRHTDALAPYPAGTTVEQAYSDIKANTGVDLPKLIDDWNKTQTLKNKLTPEELRLGRAAGVIPKLKPRDTSFPSQLELPSQNVQFPTQERLTWTNRDNLPSAGNPPIESITNDNINQLPGAQKLNTNNLQPTQQTSNLIQPDALPEPQSKIIIGKQKDGSGFKESLKKFYSKTVNSQQPIFDVGKEANSDVGKLASNTKNVSGIVDYNLLKGLVDKNGNKVGESLKDVVEAIPKGKEQDFWTYMSQRHNIDRAREGKPVQANYTPDMSTKAVQIAEQNNPEYKAIGDKITNWIDNFMKTWGVDTGIVNKDLYDNLRQTYKNYFPTQRDFSQLEDAIPEGVRQKFVDQRTPIKKATGSERDIIDPVENIMNLVNRTIRTAKYNEVGQSLLDAVRKNPEKMMQYAEVIEPKDGMFSNKDNVISVLENGKPTYLQINNKMLLDAMNGLPKTIGKIPVLDPLMNGFKGLITQKNPIFALRNIFRDIPTSYVYGSENNPIKFGKDLLGAGKDILTNSPNFQRYQAVGGGGANFFNSGDVTKAASELIGNGSKIKNAITKPIEAIEKFNNITETAPRLAEFNRVYNQTGDVNKALFAANDVSVNFSRSGNITKNVDKVVPYLNAGVQGLDKFFRGFKDPKVAVSTLVKSGVALSTPEIATYLINKDNPNYQELDNRTKDTYFLIPNLSNIDENGNAKTFIKIPKSRELGVLFSSLLERILRATNGEENAFKGYGNAIATSFAPANPIDSNFIAPATWNIATNKDFANRSIVPQGMLTDNRSPYLQYDEKTSELAKWFANLVKDIPMPKTLKDIVGSPKRIDYLIKSYTGVIGQLGLPIVTNGGSPLKSLTTQFVSDPVFSNQSTTDFYDKLDKLSREATDNNIVNKIPSKKLTTEEDMRNSMNAISSALSKATKQINLLQASSDPNKDEKIREIKIQVLRLTQQANSANNQREMQMVENKAKKTFK